MSCSSKNAENFCWQNALVLFFVVFISHLWCDGIFHHLFELFSPTSPSLSDRWMNWRVWFIKDVSFQGKSKIIIWKSKISQIKIFQMCKKKRFIIQLSYSKHVIACNFSCLFTWKCSCKWFKIWYRFLSGQLSGLWNHVENCEQSHVFSAAIYLWNSWKKMHSFHNFATSRDPTESWDQNSAENRWHGWTNYIFLSLADQLTCDI